MNSLLFLLGTLTTNRNENEGITVGIDTWMLLSLMPSATT